LLDDVASSLVFDALACLGEPLVPTFSGDPDAVVLPASKSGGGKALVVFLLDFGGIVVASFDER
jgi:hypothetical protein